MGVAAAQRRVDMGTYALRHCTYHPCLVPYEDLPESEKEYDRNAALGTIRAVIACGYRITIGATDRES